MVGAETVQSESRRVLSPKHTDLDSHCGAGCISGCPSTPPPTISGVAPRGDGQCGAVSLVIPWET